MSAPLKRIRKNGLCAAIEDWLIHQLSGRRDPEDLTRHRIKSFAIGQTVQPTVDAPGNLAKRFCGCEICQLVEPLLRPVQSGDAESDALIGGTCRRRFQIDLQKRAE